MPAHRRVYAASGVALLVLALATTSATAASRTARAEQRLRAGMEADLRQDAAIPGEALAVSAPGLHVALAVGRADVRAGTALEPDTPFRVASVTKTFVAAAVLRLVERHELGLDRPIARYLSRASLATLRDGGYRPDRITVRQLLRHTAGLFDYAESPEYDHVNTVDPGHRWTRAEQLRFAVDHGAPVAGPGRVFHYSDTAYVLLGEIIERVTGTTLAASVRSLLHFRRIGLFDTYWEQLEAAPEGQKPRAHQYDDAFDNVTLDASHDLYGGGGLVSAVADLASFYRALFHGRVFDHARTLVTMKTVTGPGRSDGAAMGLFALDVAGERCYSHPGYWGTDTTYCPRLDLAFARTINQADDDDFDYRPLERVVVGVVERDSR